MQRKHPDAATDTNRDEGRGGWGKHSLESLAVNMIEPNHTSLVFNRGGHEQLGVVGPGGGGVVVVAAVAVAAAASQEVVVIILITMRVGGVIADILFIVIHEGTSFIRGKIHHTYLGSGPKEPILMCLPCRHSLPKRQPHNNAYPDPWEDLKIRSHI